MPFEGYAFYTDPKVILLTDRQRWWLVKLLWHQWMYGAIPLNEPTLRQWVYPEFRSRSPKEWTDFYDKVATFFPPLDEYLGQNEKLHKIREAEFDRERRKQGQTQRRMDRLAAARRKATHTDEEWDAILATVNGRCPRCRQRAAPLHKDHIIPLELGGHDGIENLQPLCQHCNVSKGDDATNYLLRFLIGLRETEEM